MPDIEKKPEPEISMHPLPGTSSCSHLLTYDDYRVFRRWCMDYLRYVLNWPEISVNKIFKKVDNLHYAYLDYEPDAKTIIVRIKDGNTLDPDIIDTHQYPDLKDRALFPTVVPRNWCEFVLNYHGKNKKFKTFVMLTNMSEFREVTLAMLYRTKSFHHRELEGKFPEIDIELMNRMLTEFYKGALLSKLESSDDGGTANDSGE